MGKSTLSPMAGSGIGVAADTQPARAPDERPSARVALLRKEKAVRLPRTILDPEQTAALRERLLLDLDQLQSTDEAADWVHKNLAAKNTLTAADADAVEAGFREKLATIEVASAARQERLHPAPAEDPDAPPSILIGFVWDRDHRTHAGLAAEPGKQSAQEQLGIDAIRFRSAQTPIHRYARRLDDMNLDALRHEPPRQPEP